MKDIKNRKLKLLVMAVSLLFAAGCTNELRYVDSTMLESGKVHLLKRGVTTKEELLKSFGKPESAVSLDGGKESVFYKDLNLRSLWVELSKDGIVTDFKYSGK